MLTKRSIVLLLCLLCSTNVFADAYHYINMLLGDRASGMGGSYVAISDDTAGLYYNPAGIVYSAGSNISGSMNAYHYQRTTYSNVLSGKDWIRTTNSLIPNFFGMTQRLGPGTFGFSYAVTDSVLEDQDQIFPGVPGPGSNFIINFNNQDVTYNLGPSYAIEIINGLSIGLTMYGFVHEQEQILSQSFDFYTANEFHLESSLFHIEEYGVKPVLGIMYAPVPKVSLGASFSYTYIGYSYARLQRTCTTNYTGGTVNAPCILGEFFRDDKVFYSRNEYPWKLDLGLAVFPSPSLALSLSSNIHQPWNGMEMPVINIASGIEYYVSPRWALRGGIYTNFANTPEIVVGQKFQKDHVDLFGSSLSLSHFTRSSVLTVGVAGQYGSGQAQIIAGRNDIYATEVVSATAFMSSTYSF